MTIKYEDLVLILKSKEKWRGEVSPREPLYIEFQTSERKASDTTTYQTTEGLTVAIDLNKDEEVIGVEIV